MLHATTRSLFGLLLAAIAAAPTLPPPDPLISVWYRGRPAGVPRADDLAAIRAAGFAAITWPLAQAARLAELTRLADESGLTVVVRAPERPMTSASALHPGERVDLLVARAPADELRALAWRSVGHGARVLSIDSGQPEGAGLTDSTGRAAPWVAPAAGLARQFRVNGALIAQLRPMPPLSVDPPAPGALDVALLEAGKSWVAIATNTSRARVRAAVRLPADVPYALWLNLLDGASLAMLADREGPKWNVDLEPWGVRVLVIDKKLK